MQPVSKIVFVASFASDLACEENPITFVMGIIRVYTVSFSDPPKENRQKVMPDVEVGHYFLRIVLASVLKSNGAHLKESLALCLVRGLGYSFIEKLLQASPPFRLLPLSVH